MSDVIASADNSEVVVTMIRCSTLLIRWAGMSFLTDPWFGMSMRGLPVFRRPGLTPEALPPLDAILASHLHPDHWDDDALTRFVAPPRQVLLPPGAFEKIGRQGTGWEELPPWQSTMVGPVKVWAVPGPHTLPPPDEINFLLELPGWGRLFFGGDAIFHGPTLDAIGRQFAPVRIALLPVGGTRIFGKRTTMAPEDALAAALALRAETIVPIHEGGIWMSVPPLSMHPGRAVHLRGMFARRGEPDRVRVLAEGASLRL